MQMYLFYDIISTSTITHAPCTLLSTNSAAQGLTSCLLILSKVSLHFPCAPFPVVISGEKNGLYREADHWL